MYPPVFYFLSLGNFSWISWFSIYISLRGNWFLQFYLLPEPSLPTCFLRYILLHQPFCKFSTAILLCSHSILYYIHISIMGKTPPVCVPLTLLHLLVLFSLSLSHAKASGSENKWNDNHFLFIVCRYVSKSYRNIKQHGRYSVNTLHIPCNPPFYLKVLIYKY